MNGEWSDGTWKGVDKPAGSNFYTPDTHTHLIDCPKCKYGTLEPSEKYGMLKCIDCGAVVNPLELKRPKRDKNQ